MAALAIPRATILWERLDVPGLEWCQASPTPSGGRLDGLALVDWEGVPYRLAYTINVDEVGRARRVLLNWGDGAKDGALELESDGSGAWQQDGRPIFTSPEALDVDLGFSPLTNSLPIWRFGQNLRVGQSRDIAVAWLLFPELEVVVGDQTYERLGQRVWRYRSAAFEAELEVGEDGLVDRYGDLWRVLTRR
jgi:uncharacterized protein